jgi:uncharacterized protein with HEPN domain
MQQGDRDAAYLWDMLDAANTVREFTLGVEFEQYSQDRMLQLAVERAIEIIGEAARYVSETFKKSHPEIPWRNIIAQRNVLAHVYGEIDQERIWVVVKVHIPELIANLVSLIPPLPPEIKDDSI